MTEPQSMLANPEVRARLEFTLSQDPAAPGRARALARESAAALSLAALAPALELLVHELVANSVRHASPSEIRLRIDRRTAGLRIEVEDDGPGLSAAPPQPSAESEGGWGLYLVEQLSARWGIARNSGSSVWFEIDAG